MRVAAPADKRFRRAHVHPPRRRHSWARALGIVRSAAALVLFAAGAYLLQQQVAQARALHVDRIAVRGNQRLSTGEVLVLLEGLRGQHLLAVDLDRWQRRVMSSPWVGHASLRRVLPSTVEVTLSERQPMAIGRLGADLYLIDAAGCGSAKPPVSPENSGGHAPCRTENAGTAFHSGTTFRPGVLQQD